MNALLPLATRTAFADLTARCADAAFDADFPENGRFQVQHDRGRGYFYFRALVGDGEGGKRILQRYVGPADDPVIAARVAAFGHIKANGRERRTLVAQLRAAGLGQPTGPVGDVIAALARAGIFRLRGVLVGTTAFGAYGGLLGMRLPEASVTTDDVDFAQSTGVSMCVDDSIPPVTRVLGEVDPTFRPIPRNQRGYAASSFVSERGLKVEFLTPNRGSDDHSDDGATMPALGGAVAQPLRFLDFLIRHPVPSVLLRGTGIPVVVPAPERFLVHKLIVSHRRARNLAGSMAKSAKDVRQSGILLRALEADGRLDDAGAAWREAWERGPKWREGLTAGRARLHPEEIELLERGVRLACVTDGGNPAELGFGSASPAP